MAQNKQALKSRIRSIKATMKITSAMELIANSKLAKQRNIMEKNREYAEVLQNTVADIMASNPDIESCFLTKKKSDKVLSIVFSSDIGLCGAYNINILKMAKSILSSDDPCIVVGTKLHHSMINEGFKVINDVCGIDDATYDILVKLVNQAIEMYAKDEVGKIQVIYTKFINTVTFEPAVNVLLPYEAKAEGKKQETIFEPSAEQLLDELIVLMTQSVVYSLSLETKTAEQASRRMAMENANDNADELKDKLILAYNQARQAAITQEITEIVSGADAL